VIWKDQRLILGSLASVRRRRREKFTYQSRRRSSPKLADKFQTIFISHSYYTLTRNVFSSAALEDPIIAQIPDLRSERIRQYLEQKGLLHTTYGLPKAGGVLASPLNKLYFILAARPPESFNSPAFGKP
jgi:hypothetical protein